jgi:hypothetical protein
MKNVMVKILIMLGAMTAHAGEGADIGGGTIDDLEGSEGQYVEAPSYDYDYSDPVSYCTYTASTLDAAVLNAVRQGRRQNFAGARATLIAGIQNAIRRFNRWSWDYQPLTKEALQRALELDRAFNNKCGVSRGEQANAAAICQSDRRSLRFLIGYLQHIKNEVVPFETEYHIPYRSRGWDNHTDYDWEVFVSHYKDVATSLLEVYTGKGPDGQMPNAFGADVYELRAASKLFYWAAYDLRRDDYNRSYRCEIAGLRSMSDQLASQLAHNTIGSNMEAVEMARDYAIDTLDRIESVTSCGRRPHHGRSRDSRRW